MMLKMKILNTKPMKKKLFFSFGILAGTVSFMNAQNVYIPDANFKAYLVSSPGIILMVIVKSQFQKLKLLLEAWPVITKILLILLVLRHL